MELNKRFIYYSLITTVIFALLLSACGQNSANTTSKNASSLQEQASVYSNGSLTLQLESPQDNATYSTQQINFAGSVSEDATMTINDEIYLLTAGKFTQPISLEKDQTCYRSL
jgi:hypothetical protein